MSNMMSTWDPQGDLGACWAVLDPKGKGKIRLEDLMYLLRTYGALVPEEEIAEMFEDYLENFTEINFAQFLDAIVGT